MSDEVDFVNAERLLRAAEFEDCEPIWYSSNYVYAARLCSGDNERFAAVYKPLKGESPLWDFPEGALYKKEVAAYELSRLLGWPFVPPTVVRDGPHGVGSVQVFIAHDPEAHFFVQRDVPGLVPQLQRMAVFDVIANNADRKGGHCLLDDEGTIWGIDHGLCFHPQYKLRSVIWDWVDEPIAEEWLGDVKSAGAKLEERSAEARPLLELLTTEEAAAMGRRIKTLLKQRTFPGPGPNRHYPWPLV
ncbi:MAG: SCO1664 family protein [Anaerolineaceae bacterium]